MINGDIASKTDLWKFNTERIQRELGSEGFNCFEQMFNGSVGRKIGLLQRVVNIIPNSKIDSELAHRIGSNKEEYIGGFVIKELGNHSPVIQGRELKRVTSKLHKAINGQIIDLLGSTLELQGEKNALESLYLNFIRVKNIFDESSFKNIAKQDYEEYFEDLVEKLLCSREDQPKTEIIKEARDFLNNLVGKSNLDSISRDHGASLAAINQQKGSCSLRIEMQNLYASEIGGSDMFSNTSDLSISEDPAKMTKKNCLETVSNYLQQLNNEQGSYTNSAIPSAITQELYRLESDNKITNSQNNKISQVFQIYREVIVKEKLNEIKSRLEFEGGFTEQNWEEALNSFDLQEYLRGLDMRVSGSFSRLLLSEQDIISEIDASFDINSFTGALVLK